MATLFAKARIAVLAVSHNLLDKVIDLNSIQAVRQYARDLETSIDQIEADLAENRGSLTGATRERSRIQQENVKLDGQIDAVLNDNDPTNDHLAKTLQARFNGNKRLLQAKQEEVDSVTATIASMEDVLASLKAKLQDMQANIASLESLDRGANAKERAARAIKRAGSADLEGMDSSVDNVSRRIQHRADVADAALNAQLGAFNSSTERNAQLSEVDADLAERRARLATNKEEPATAK